MIFAWLAIVMTALLGRLEGQERARDGEHGKRGDGHGR